MKVKSLKLISYIYIILPIIIFVLGYLKLIFSIPISIILLFILLKLFNMYKIENEKFIDKHKIVIIFFSVFII